jgi:hypothetical protein
VPGARSLAGISFGDGAKYCAWAAQKHFRGDVVAWPQLELRQQIDRPASQIDSAAKSETDVTLI